MFIGHYGPAVWDTQRGRGKPIIKLWEAFLAVQAIDIVTGVLMIIGIEGVVLNDEKPVFYIPWSHSLASAILIAILSAALYKFMKKSSGKRECIVIAMLAFSHWVLDLVVHRPDLPLHPHGELLLGFALWDFPLIAFALEAGLLAAALLFWQRVTVPKTKLYNYLIWVLFGLMILLHYVFIVEPGLQVKASTFDINTLMSDQIQGYALIATIIGLAFFIGLIERGRPPRFSKADHS